MKDFDTEESVDCDIFQASSNCSEGSESTCNTLIDELKHQCVVVKNDCTQSGDEASSQIEREILSSNTDENLKPLNLSSSKLIIQEGYNFIPTKVDAWTTKEVETQDIGTNTEKALCCHAKPTCKYKSGFRKHQRNHKHNFNYNHQNGYYYQQNYRPYNNWQLRRLYWQYQQQQELLYRGFFFFTQFLDSFHRMRY